MSHTRVFVKVSHSRESCRPEECELGVRKRRRVMAVSVSAAGREGNGERVRICTSLRSQPTTAVKKAACPSSVRHARTPPASGVPPILCTARCFFFACGPGGGGRNEIGASQKVKSHWQQRSAIFQPLFFCTTSPLLTQTFRIDA